MPDTSSILSLPLLMPAQAQKHVTHNEALQLLEAVVQLVVETAGAASPPPGPVPGSRYLVGTAATGAWAGRDQMLAVYDGAIWRFIAPMRGWSAEVPSEARRMVFDGSVWIEEVPDLDNLVGVGIGTTSDAVNRLAVAAQASLFSHAGSGHQMKLNKALATDTASLLYQSGWSGRAEMGLNGSDDWSLKVSANGAAWTEALKVSGATGLVSGAAVQTSAQDATPGRLMRADFGYSARTVLGPVSQSAGIPSGALIERGSNANGKYVRFADGTQICTHSLSVIDVATASGALYSSASIDWVFPAVFSGGLDSFGGALDLSGAWVVRGASSFSNSIARLAAMRSTTATGTFSLKAFAIGRWFV